jgi:hypothetical protein
MAVKTQGSDLYFVDPHDNDVVKVGCVTQISGINAARDQIEVTCLDSAARIYEAGLGAPGAATFGINFDPQDDSHVRVHELYVEGVKINWALGWSDGTADPTADTDGEIVADGSRSWIVFNGYISDFPFDVNLNSVVQSNVSIQVSDFPVVIPASS